MLPLSPVPAQVAAASPLADLGDLKRKSVRGGMITFVSQGVSVSLGLVSTVVLARLLSPADYGVMAMVVAVTSFAGLFRDLGLSSAAIQKHTLTNAQQSNLFWINVALGATLTVLLAAAAPLVAWFYGRPEVLWVMVALSASFLIGSLATQSGALLVREMRFGRQALATISGGLVNLTIAVTLALHGFRYWSLVWGTLTGGLVSTILLFLLSPFRPRWASRGTGLREMLKFGANITAFDFVNYFHRNLDNILIGRFWGAEALGVYSRAYALLLFPINNLRGPINAVAFPALSRLQNQPEAYRLFYRRIVALLGLVSMPLSAFLMLNAHPVIELLLGPKWEEVAPIFSVLATVSFVQPVVTLWGTVVLSSGLGRRYLQLGVFNTICSALGFCAGLTWGAMGVATGYAIVTYATAYPMLAWAFRGTPLRIQDFLSAIARPLIASTFSACLCLVASHWLAGGQELSHLIFQSVLFVSAYAATFYCLPGGKSELVQLWKLVSPGKPRTSAMR